jgi:DNA-binding transcriptional regulator YiaG
VTLTADTGNARHPESGTGARPVEYWPTTAIRSALETGDISVWQRIAVAIKRDPYGRTARQVEEVLEAAPPQGITRALSEVMIRSRQHLEATERAEAARHIRSLVARSGLSQQEFASRIGVPTDDLVQYLDGRVSPPASLVIRIRRLSDRFARIRAQRPEG